MQAAKFQEKGNDVEAVTAESDRRRRKKRTKCLAYAAAFAVFQTVIILVFVLTVLRFKDPMFQIRSITVEELTTGNSSASFPTLNMRFSAEVTVKNTNFGHFKFDKSTITFVYKGTQVGDAVVPKARAKARSTKKMKVAGSVTTANANLRNDISLGLVALSGQAKLNGKIHLIKVIKKKKSAKLSCTMVVNLTNKAVQDLKCV